VLEIALPPEIRAAMAPTAPSSSSSPSSSPSSDPGATEQPPADDATSHDLWPWLLGGGLAVAALLVLVRALRPR
jgi:hypothetical protein